MAAPKRLRRARKLFVRAEDVLNQILKEDDNRSSSDNDSDDQDNDFEP